MKSTIILVITITISGCIGTDPIRPALAPNSPYNQIGATVYSPNETGWFLSRASNKRSIVFGRKDGTPANSIILNTLTFKVKNIKKDSDFLNHIEKAMRNNNIKTRFKTIAINSKQVSFKDTACLKYQGLSEDHKSSGINSDTFLYFKTSGYICRHTFNKSIAFRMEVSHRSKSKGFSEGLLQTSEAFFSTIKFNSNGLRK